MMYGDSVGDRVLLWLARRFPSKAGPLHGRVNDRRLVRAMDRQAAAREALRREQGGG